MFLSHDQLVVLNLMLAEIENECRVCPIGNILENHLKVVVLSSLLQHGYAVMESSNRKDLGRVIWLEGGLLRQRFEERNFMAAAPGSEKVKNSPDIRVWEPCSMVVELQVRSEFGSQSSLFSENLADDLDRIDRHAADVFILAADLSIYESLRGQRANACGRKAKYGAFFSSSLLDSKTLPTSFSPPVEPVQCDNRFVWACKVIPKFGVDRVIIGVCSADRREDYENTRKTSLLEELIA